MRELIVMALLPAALMSCRGPVWALEDSDLTGCHALARLELEPERARSDAAAAFRAGRRHLLAIQGYAAEVPGGEGARLPVQMIAGTSDNHASQACADLNARARAYAKAYNQAMIVLADR